MDKVIKYWYKSDKLFLLPILFSLLSAILISLGFLIFSNKLPVKLPLFYSLPWGQTQLINKQQILILPGVLILITLINVFISSQLHTIQLVLKRILILSLVLINLIIFITAVKILFIFI